MGDVVVFYRDTSRASERVYEELGRRQLQYETIWDDGLIRMLPAIEFRSSLFEGVPNIEVYFFGMLDSVRDSRPANGATA